LAIHALWVLWVCPSWDTTSFLLAIKAKYNDFDPKWNEH
jgi:hypothetical protein